MLVSVVLLLAPGNSADAADCGDKAGPGNSRVACACGDTVVTNVRLKPNDPVVANVCVDDGLIVGADDIVIDCSGRTIAGSATGTGILALGRTVTGVTVKKCLVTGFRDGISFASASHENSIISNEIVGNVRLGVFIGAFGEDPIPGDGFGNVVSKNTISGSSFNVVSQFTSSAEISRNVLSNAGSDAFRGFDSAGQMIFSNTIQGSGLRGIHGFLMTDSTIEKNDVSGCNTEGILLEVGSHRNLVKGNVLTGNGLVGIPSNGIFSTFALKVGSEGAISSDFNVVTGNELADNGRGILVIEANDNEISGNTVSNGDRLGMLLVGKLYTFGLFDGTGNVFSNNTVKGLDIADFFDNLAVLLPFMGILDADNTFDELVSVQFRQPAALIAAVEKKEGSPGTQALTSGR